jgi:hypothetical protein
VSKPADLAMGDFIVVLLASTLAGLRDRLFHDGYKAAAELVADLVDIVDDYLTNVIDPSGPHGSDRGVVRPIR